MIQRSATASPEKRLHLLIMDCRSRKVPDRDSCACVEILLRFRT